MEQFGTLEKVLAGVDQIKAKGVRTKIAENKESALLSQELVTIMLDVPIEYSLDAFKRQSFDYEKSKTLFRELEFNTILKTILGEGAESADEAPESRAAVDYRTIDTIAGLKKLLRELAKTKEVAFDTETTSLDAFEAKLVGVSLCAGAGKAYYLPLGHSGEGEKNLPIDETLDLLKPFFSNPKIQKFAQNAKYDIEVLGNYGITVDPISFDTMLGSYVVNPSGRQHSLEFLALTHFGYQMQPISDLIGSGKSQKSFDIVPVDKATFYAAEDADYTYRLRGVLAPKIQEMSLQRVYYDIEMPSDTGPGCHGTGRDQDRQGLPRRSFRRDGLEAGCYQRRYLQDRRRAV